MIPLGTRDNNSAATSLRSAPADDRRLRRRQGFAALGISVLESADDPLNADLADIKFRGNASGGQRSELEIETSLMQGRTKEQAQILAIAHGLQEGIEDLLAGRIFHPGGRDKVDLGSSSADSETSSTLAPTSPKEIKAEEAERQETVQETAEPVAAAVKMKKKLAGMPGWMEGEVQSDEEEDSSNEDGSGRADPSDDDSLDGFLNINYNDIDDIVQETDDSKIEQQVNAGRAATNRIMYEWKEFARVRLTEELNDWFQQRKEKGGEEVAELDSTENDGNQTMVSQSEGIREVKSGIEKKEMALFATISCFQQKFAKRIDEHWEAKRKIAEEVLARVQQEEEEKRQERLRRQAERAAKRFHDIDDQIADLKDNIEQVKGDIHKMELTKHTVPQTARRNSTGNKAAEVLSIISSQQEEAQVLSAKLAMGSRKLESLEDAVEKAKIFFNSAAFKSKKIRIPPADDPAYLLVSEAIIKQMQTILAQLMLEDELLAESVTLAHSTLNRPGGKKKVRNGLIRLEDTRKDLQDQALAGSESFRAVEEVVVSNDPVERQQKFQEIEAECMSLREEIEILHGVLQQPILPRKAQEDKDADETPGSPRNAADAVSQLGQLTKDTTSEGKPTTEEAYRQLLSAASETVEIIRQKKAVLSSERGKSKSRRSEFSSGGDGELSASPSIARGELTQVAQQLTAQQTRATRLSEEEKNLKMQLKRLRAAAGTQEKRKEDQAAKSLKAPGAPGSSNGQLQSGSQVPARGLQDGSTQPAKSSRQDGMDGDGDQSEEFLDDVQPGDTDRPAGAPAADGAPPSPSSKDGKKRRRISRLEAANPDEALAKQLKDNKAAAEELEALRKQLQDLKNAASTEGAPLSPTRSRRNSRVHISEPSGESAGEASASPTSTRSRSRRSSSRRSVSAARRSSAKLPAEDPPVSEEQRQENELKLKDLIAACQKLTDEKEAFEKELASIEDKIRRVKSMDSGGVVALLKQDAQQEKKADSTEVKELKAEIKKKTSQVNAMRRTWQEMQGSSKRNSAGVAAEEERQREVAKRFAHVLSFLRAAKAAELSKEAESAGLVTESGNAEVVGRSASKFLLSIRKEKMAAQLSENLKAQGATPASPQRRPSVSRNALIAPSPLPSPGTSPVLSPIPSPGLPDDPGASRQGFNLIMAEAMTGHRSSIAGLQHSATSSDDETSARPSRRTSASTSLQVPRTSDDGEVRRRSFNNILEKARMRKPKEEEVMSPGAKATALVRFASDG